MKHVKLFEQFINELRKYKDWGSSKQGDLWTIDNDKDGPRLILMVNKEISLNNGKGRGMDTNKVKGHPFFLTRDSDVLASFEYDGGNLKNFIQTILDKIDELGIEMTIKYTVKDLEKIFGWLFEWVKNK